jgi:DNA excision repair protein ERCC-1
VTLILCWSAAEAARYLELYKSYEHAGFGAIRGQQATSYAEKLVEFVTVPRNINKADAVALVSTFGSLRHAVNADPEQVAVVGGWGEKKVKSWCKAVEAPFRVQNAAKRKATRVTAAVPIGGVSSSAVAAARKVSAASRKADVAEDEAEEDALIAAAEAAEATPVPATAPAQKGDHHLSEGVAAALARLREKG